MACLRPGQHSDVSEGGMASQEFRNSERWGRWRRAWEARKRGQEWTVDNDLIQ